MADPEQVAGEVHREGSLPDLERHLEQVGVAAKCLRREIGSDIEETVDGPVRIHRGSDEARAAAVVRNVEGHCDRLSARLPNGSCGLLGAAGVYVAQDDAGTLGS